MKAKPTRLGRFATRVRRGSAVMEMALVGSLLLGLTFGTIEFGYYFYVKNILQGAAREGCRAGITPTGDNTAVTTAVVTYLYNGGLQTGSVSLDSSKFTLTITPSASTAAAGAQVKVQLQSTWGVIGNGFRPMGLIGSAKTVTGVSTMRKEG